ncbi:MAG: hypothetical protein FWC34_00485 [Bacteroidetes bacterium]|nr:hypothetical protein [Bacteroidota bacterium]
MILKAGVTGFGKNRLLTLMEITNVLKNINFPYIYSNILEPKMDTNYFSIDIINKKTGIDFKLLINGIYFIMAGVTTKSKWMELIFIDLPEDFIKQTKNDEIIFLNKSILNTCVPTNEIEVLKREEKEQIKYWGSKTYGEIIFNGYD